MSCLFTEVYLHCEMLLTLSLPIQVEEIEGSIVILLTVCVPLAVPLSVPGQLAVFNVGC